MRHITKGKEPPSLTQYRLTPSATYDDYREKADLRAALLRDQGHLCCYCMQRISAERMRIEHWSPQSQKDGLDLAYKNLLGACQGGERKPPERPADAPGPGHYLPKPLAADDEREPIHAYHHCDVHKRHLRLTVHPADPNKNCELVLRYLPDGEITSDDPAVRNDLNHTLNLNLRKLKQNRKQVIDTAVKVLQMKHPKGDWPPGLLEREILRRKTPDAEGMLGEYCQVAVYFLQKKLNRKK